MFKLEIEACLSLHLYISVANFVILPYKKFDLKMDVKWINNKEKGDIEIFCARDLNNDSKRN